MVSLVLLLLMFHRHKGEEMNIEQIKEAKENLEHDIQRLIMVFERDTQVKVDAVRLDVDEYFTMGGDDSIRDIKVGLEVRI